MDPINITEIIPLGMTKEQAIVLAEKISRTMRVMWLSENGPGKLSPVEFALTALNYCGTPESKRFLMDRMIRVFSEKEIENIIRRKNDFVRFIFNGEEIFVKAESPQPA